MVTAPSPRTEAYEHPDPARQAAFRRVYENYLVAEDVYPGMARRFLSVGVRRFVELGGAHGPISALLAARGVRSCVVDLDQQMLREANCPALQADIGALPLQGRSFDGAAAVNCLYFLSDPRVALREVLRALQPGGLFVASSPSRWNDPELEGLDPRWGTPSSFDAEDAPSLVAEVFGEVEVEQWRVPAYVLPDRAAVADYLHAFNVPDWKTKARGIALPLIITKIGAQVWARA